MKFKRLTTWLLVAALTVGLVAGFSSCGAKTGDDKGKEPAQSTRVFTDSAGREVTLPAEIGKIAPSGPLAQIVLYTACPDKLAGVANDFPDAAKGFIDDKYWNLPKFGQFYGKNNTLNMEELIKASPDVVVDIGEAKATVKDDMDGLQTQIGIPVVFIEAKLDNMDKAYEMLGQLTGDEKETGKLGEFCKKVMARADKITAGLKPEDKVRVYYAAGEKGLNTNAVGSFHAEVIDKAGGDNVAKVEVNPKGAGSEVSMENVILWDPEVIITDSKDVYNLITGDKTWGSISAVKNKKVFMIPTAPYNAMGSPPSVNRIFGLTWLGNILYPEMYKDDMVKKLQEFYDNFYHVKVDDAKAKEILGKG